MSASEQNNHSGTASRRKSVIVMEGDDAPELSGSRRQINNNSVRMRTASKDFPLGAFAPTFELPKKSNREAVLESIRQSVGMPGGKKERQLKADLAVAEGLAELGQIRVGGSGGSPSAAGRAMRKSRALGHTLDGSNSHSSSLMAVPDDSPVSFGRGGESGRLRTQQQSKRDLSLRDSLGLPDAFFATRESLFGTALLRDTTTSYQSLNTTQLDQMAEIAAFASMVQDQSNRGSFVASSPFADADGYVWEDDEEENEHEGYHECCVSPMTLRDRIMGFFDPTDYLMHDIKLDKSGVPYFEDRWSGWGLAGFIRTNFFNPLYPEFTALQQFNWACVIGIVMGFFTAFWHFIIETCVDFVWEKVPGFLLDHGVFTELEGHFPLYNYMWICPAFFGGILSYIFAMLPNKIPDQNEWINNIHTRGVQDFRTFWVLFVLATAGMASGLSLGPELPLILTSGMAGSWLGIICKQSVLQARVMNLTAASAAIGGFFGFPMAGALFVLEIPHRMGLQYFEALSPATIASIAAVLCNRLVTGNDVTGYYRYPFLTATLPSKIFTSAIVYGFYGAGVGIWYVFGTKKLKGLVHDWFHAQGTHHDTSRGEEEVGLFAEFEGASEKKPLLVPMGHKQQTQTKQHVGLTKRLKGCTVCTIPHEPYRAAAAGTLAGAIVGTICMFVPHVMFWGEAQLQTIIDRGLTPLPIFGHGEEPTAGLTAMGYCMVDHSDSDTPKEFGIWCSFVISAAKIVVTGLSLGTGITGGHFWAPLFVGCSASHILVDGVKQFSSRFGFGGELASYPCVALLCTMGSTHVVTYRAHTAIMLILTLTISAFNPENGEGGSPSVAGDYSAVFPLLVVSVFVALMVSRHTIFYPTQRWRGDIMAVPEVLCEPGMEGRPMAIVHDDSYKDYSMSSDEGEYQEASSFKEETRVLTSGKIEEEFTVIAAGKDVPPSINASSPASPAPAAATSAATASTPRGITPFHTKADNLSAGKSFDAKNVFDNAEAPEFDLASSRLDELLSRPMGDTAKQKPPLQSGFPENNRQHRRVHSAPVGGDEDQDDVHDLDRRFGTPRSRTMSTSSKDSASTSKTPGSRRQHTRTDSGSNLVRITAYGEVKYHQPSLMDQARIRAASSAEDSRHRLGHVRKASDSSNTSRSRRRGKYWKSGENLMAAPVSRAGPPKKPEVCCALSLHDIDNAFDSLQKSFETM